jgi:hypothetical protein
MKPFCAPQLMLQYWLLIFAAVHVLQVSQQWLGMVLPDLALIWAYISVLNTCTSSLLENIPQQVMICK